MFQIIEKRPGNKSSFRMVTINCVCGCKTSCLKTSSAFINIARSNFLQSIKASNESAFLIEN